MRQVLMGDVIAAARSLLEVPPSERRAAISKMLYHAHIADKVMKRTGSPHRKWGNDSLMAAAFPKPKQGEPFLSNLDYLYAMRLILEQLIAWKQARQPSIRRHDA